LLGVQKVTPGSSGLLTDPNLVDLKPEILSHQSTNGLCSSPIYIVEIYERIWCFYIPSLTIESNISACKKLLHPYSTKKTHLQTLFPPADAYQYEENRQVQTVLQSI